MSKRPFTDGRPALNEKFSNFPASLCGYRVIDRLASSPRGDTCSVSESRRSRRARWVLKPLPWCEGDGLPALLRRDLLDLAGLRHPALALPCSVARDEGRRSCFAVRPFIAGTDLHSLERRPWAETLPFLAAAAEALEVLHREGFLHGNLKGSNLHIPVRLRSASRPSRVVLSDPALLLEEIGPGREDPSPASDLRDLGVVFYLLLGGDRSSLARNEFPEPLRAKHPSLPLDLDRLVMRLLHPRPGSRYQEARLLAEDLLLLGHRRGRTVRALRPRAHPPDPDRFLDREEELRAVRPFLARRACPFFLDVSGEAGIGKTAFLHRLEMEAQLLGYRTVLSTCFPEGSSPGLPLRAIAGIPGPALLIIDDAHLADARTLEGIAGAMRAIAASGEAGQAKEPRPPSLAIARRNEGPFRAPLLPILDLIREKGGGWRSSVELGPLPAEWVERWMELSTREGERPLRLPPRLQGNPFAIRMALASAFRHPGPGAGSVPAARLSSLIREWLHSLPEIDRKVLEVLAVLGKPSPCDLLARVLGHPSGRVRHALEGLVREGTLTEGRGGLFFHHGSLEDVVLGSLRESRRKALHRRIAEHLRMHADPSLVESAHHRLLSDRPRADLPVVLEAARRLAREGEAGRSLSFYRAYLDLLPPKETDTRWAASEEAAEVHGRLGEYRKAAEMLARVLPRRGEGRDAGRIHGRLGAFCHRAGDPERAVRHLEKGLALLEAARGCWLDRLRILAELAEIAANRNDTRRAEALCRRALRLIARRGSAAAGTEARRVEMLVLETMAHLHLRLFRYDEARRLFERSLQACEDLGAEPEACLVLNNLGILFIQQNLFPEALRCYRRAESIAARLGDRQILSNVHSNLAVLHAKLGEPEAADQALREAETAGEACGSDRERLLRLHSSGLVDLLLGRCESGIRSLVESIRLADRLEDGFIGAFDSVYLGECHLLRGELRRARAAFQGAMSRARGGPAAIERMAAARTAALEALRRRSRASRSAAETCGRLRVSGPRPAYLDAWDDLFLGWAARLSADADSARVHLASAREFFIRTRIPAGEIHASLELAALELEGGHPARAGKRLAALRSRFTCGRGPLRSPMLCARLLAYQARALLERKDPDPEAAREHLVEAESFLVGRRLPDLELLLGRLKADLHREPRDGPGRSDRRGPGGTSAEARVPTLVGTSPGMRRVLETIRSLAPSSIPVLFTGETGVGKELAARALHEESPRRSGPFISIGCFTLPEELMEAELFGHRRGAFSGADRDRQGLLLRARGGTILFDEIGELPVRLQGKVLRVLDGHPFRPLGGEEEMETDARFVFTTSHELRSLMKEKRFRQDLLYRLGAAEVRLPPLRERTEDLPLLIRRFCAQEGIAGSPGPFDEEALAFLASYAWPGNVRELRNLVLRLGVTHAHRVDLEDLRSILQRKDISEGVFSPALLRSRPLSQLFLLLEREYLALLHEEKGGDLRAMADSLGFTERALYKRFKLVGLRPSQLRRKGR